MSALLRGAHDRTYARCSIRRGDPCVCRRLRRRTRHGRGHHGRSAAAYRGDHQPKPLPFDPAKLNGLSEKLLTLAPPEQLHGRGEAPEPRSSSSSGALPQDARAVPDGLAQARGARSRPTRWCCTSSTSGTSAATGRRAGPSSTLVKAQYGSLETWEQEFRLTGLSLAGGSGWVVARATIRTSERCTHYWAWDHTHEPRRRHAAPRHGHVRARLPDGLRRERARATSTRSSRTSTGTR